MTPPEPETFGARVRHWRTQRGYSLEELADRAGLSRTGLWQIEKGASDPGLSTALALSLALAVPLGVLAGEAPAPGALVSEAILLVKVYEGGRCEISSFGSPESPSRDAEEITDELARLFATIVRNPPSAEGGQP